MMLKPSVVMSAYRPKDWVSKRKISFRQTSMRWLALMLGCFVCFGSQYCFDTPSALEHDIEHNLEEGGMENVPANFNWLYSIYSIPNILIPLVGGMLIDRVGARVVLVVTAGICMLGQAVFAGGGMKNWFWLMLVGRAIFGVGGESLTASQNTLLSNWFEPAQLSFVLGVCISFPKLGSALNSYLSPKIAAHYHGEAAGHHQYENVYVPLFVGLGVMGIAFLVSLALFYMDMESDRREKRHHETQILSQRQPSIKPIQAKKRSESTISKGSAKGKNQMKRSEVDVVETSNIVDAANQEGGTGGHEHISLKDFKQLPGSFWLLIVVCMLSEALFIPFLDNGNLYFTTIYGIDSTEAGTFLVLPYLFCAFLCPFLGLLIDRIKWRSVVIIFSCLMFALTYGIMMFLEQQNDIPKALIALPLILLGVCCALFCTAIVPSVPMVVEPRLFGTAFGLMEMLQNLALATFPMLASIIQNTGADRREGFERQTLFYFAISVLCLLTAVFLAVVDRCKGNKMMHKNFREDYVKTVLEPNPDEYKVLPESPDA